MNRFRAGRNLHFVLFKGAFEIAKANAVPRRGAQQRKGARIETLTQLLRRRRQRFIRAHKPLERLSAERKEQSEKDEHARHRPAEQPKTARAPGGPENPSDGAQQV